MHVEKEFVICLYYFLSVYGVRTGNRCIEDLSKSFTVQLQCPAGEWIHVVQETYGDGCNATWRLKSAESCDRLHGSSQSGLVVNCNGKQSCFEAMKVQQTNCNIIDAAAEVTYNCIKGSVNMCSPVTRTVNGSVYLHSPGFPYSVGVNSSCVVRITGKTLQVTLLEQYMRSGILKISGDGRQLLSYVYINQYNKILPGKAAELVIVYENHDQNGSNLWIRVDTGQMNITISKETVGASTTTTPTQQPSRSKSTSSPSTSDRPTTMTRAKSTATVSYRTATFTHGHTTNLTGSKATQTPSKSTTIVSTTDKSTVTETVTGDQTTNTTTAVTTPTSATVVNTTMTTKDGEPSSTTTPSSGLGLIVWAASAVSGCVVTIVIVAIGVVLCRKHVKKSRPPLETPGKGHFESPSELSSMNTEEHQNGFGQNEKCNQHLVIDAEFGAGGIQSLNTEPGFRNDTFEKNQQDQYAKEPLGSTVDRYDKSTFTVTRSEADNGRPHVIRDPNGSMAANDHQGICPMTENDLYDGGFDDLREAMVDNVVYDKFDSEREKESVQDESDTSPNNNKQTLSKTCEMTENDVYDGGPTQAANENNVDDLYDVGLDLSEGMVDNGLYDKFVYDREKESRQDELDASPNHSKLAWKDGMVENIVYERGPPHLEDPVGSVADKDNHVGELYDGRLETSEGMVDSGLYEKSECDTEKESLRDESDTCIRKNWKNDCDMVENDVYERGPR